jgi:hypothetical protein
LIGFKANGDKISHHPRREKTQSNQKPRGIDAKAVSASRWSMGLVGGRLMTIINFFKLSVQID